MHRLTTFIKRLYAVGYDLKLASNYPWIYIDSINGQRVDKVFMANHGFLIGYYPKVGEAFQFSDIKEIFDLIRLHNPKRHNIT